MINRIYKGIFAGFIATIALSALMVLKAMMGMLPQMNAIKMLSTMAHGLMGTPMTPVVGWLLHFVIGSLVWGTLFALLFERIPGRTPAFKGMLFGTVAWLIMMIMIMPMAGAGLFGIHLGLGAPIATLVLHWVFGTVLGAVHGKLGTSRLVATHTHA
jgi:uncharacterized membrane protein YagU involved in acid resistance